MSVQQIVWSSENLSSRAVVMRIRTHGKSRVTLDLHQLSADMHQLSVAYVLTEESFLSGVVSSTSSYVSTSALLCLVIVCISTIWISQALYAAFHPRCYHRSECLQASDSEDVRIPHFVSSPVQPTDRQAWHPQLPLQMVIKVLTYTRGRALPWDCTLLLLLQCFLS